MAYDIDPISRGPSGDPKTPQIPAAPSGITRGKYPKDAGGPPEKSHGSPGPSGSPYEIKAQPTPVPPIPPKQSPVADTSDPTR